jgi:tRNA G18 (ribose-2'-O)-methylase SpoU
MQPIHLDRLDDSRLDVFRSLKAPRDPRFRPFFVVEGLQVTERLLASRLEVAAVVCEPRFLDRFAAQLDESVPLYVLSRESIQELAGFQFHRGVLSCGRRPVAPDTRSLLAAAPAKVTLAVCIGIQDPENLGGILRSAAALGVHAVLLGLDCADPFSRRTARTSMGANFRIPVVQPADLRGELIRMRDQWGVRLVATVLDPTADSLDVVAPADRTALLFGSEGWGLDASWVDLCDQRVTIPMEPGIDSLNASVAAGIFLHAYCRRGMRGQRGRESFSADD